jgi:hypothetical protein
MPTALLLHQPAQCKNRNKLYMTDLEHEVLSANQLPAFFLFLWIKRVDKVHTLHKQSLKVVAGLVNKGVAEQYESYHFYQFTLSHTYI